MSTCKIFFNFLKQHNLRIISRSLSASCIKCAAEKPTHDLRSPLLSSSLHSLPGNRLALFTPITSFVNCRMKSTHEVDASVSWNVGAAGIKELTDFTPLSDQSVQKGIAEQISTCIDQGDHGRLYAVVYVRTLQYKVTPGDIIIVKHDFPPNVGDTIRLEKVLAVGGSDFTLFGQPLLSRNQVYVDATVIEKTLSHNRVWSVYRKRGSFHTLRLYRERFTMLLINSVRVLNINDETTHQLEEDEKNLLT